MCRHYDGLPQSPLDLECEEQLLLTSCPPLVLVSPDPIGAEACFFGFVGLAANVLNINSPNTQLQSCQYTIKYVFYMKKEQNLYQM